MRHRVDEVVDADADSQGGKGLGVGGVVGVFPGVAQVHVVADDHHQAAFVVVDAAPVGRGAGELVLFVDLVRVDVLHAGHLVAVVQVEDGVEDGVLIRDIDDLAFREDLVHGVYEDVPFVGGVEIVAHEEAAAQQEFAEFGDLGIGQLPVAHFHRIEPRVVENIVVVVQVDGLFHGAGLDTGQAADSGGQVAVRARVVDGPVGVAFAPIEAALVFGLPVHADFRRGVHEACKSPLAGHVPVIRQRETKILPSRVLAEWALRPEGTH
jgi:hypothetical protein